MHLVILGNRQDSPPPPPPNADRKDSEITCRNIYHSVLLKIHSDDLKSGKKHGHIYFPNNVRKTKVWTFFYTYIYIFYISAVPPPKHLITSPMLEVFRPMKHQQKHFFHHLKCPWVCFTLGDTCESILQTGTSELCRNTQMEGRPFQNIFLISQHCIHH